MLTPTSRPTRQRLVDAAEKLMRTTGLASATTKAIAREAGCSEAALYKHFASKEELFVRVIHERLPNIAPLIGELIADPGERGVEECLAELVRQAARFYEEAFPMFGTLLAEPALRAQYQDGLRKIDSRPAPGRRGRRPLPGARAREGPDPRGRGPVRRRRAADGRVLPAGVLHPGLGAGPGAARPRSSPRRWPVRPGRRSGRSGNGGRQPVLDAAEQPLLHIRRSRRTAHRLPGQFREFLVGERMRIARELVLRSEP